MGNEYDSIIDTLSEEELDLLNSDPQMLADFKAKFTPKEKPSFGSKVLRGVQDFGQGSMEGATFDSMTIDDKGNPVSMPKESAEIPGSIMRDDGSAKQSFSQKYSGVKGAGRAVGSVIPMVASELLAGAAAPALALKYGMGPVKAAMNSMGMTMAAFEGMKGAFQNKSPLDTAGSMAEGYVAGLPVGAAGYGVEKGLNWLTSKAPVELANQYLRTPSKIADSLKDKGKPDLGRQFLDKTKFDSTTSKGDQFNEIRGNLEDNRMLVGDTLAKADEVAAMPKTPTVKSEYVPEREVDFYGERNSPPQYKRGSDVGEYIEIKKPQPTPEPPQTKYGGFERTTESGYGGTSKKGPLGEDVRVSNIQEGQGIDLDEVRGAVNDVIGEQSDIGGGVSALSDLVGPAGVAQGEKVVSNSRAFQILSRLDADVNKAYQAIDVNTISPVIEARAAMANRLRDLLRQRVPQAAELLGKNHSLQLFESSLLPQVSGRPPVGGGGNDWMKAAAANTLGSRAGLGVARRLDAFAKPGTVSNAAAKFVAPAVKTGGRLGLADYLSEQEKKSGNSKRR